MILKRNLAHGILQVFVFLSPLVAVPLHGYGQVGLVDIVSPFLYLSIFTLRKIRVSLPCVLLLLVCFWGLVSTIYHIAFGVISPDLYLFPRFVSFCALAFLVTQIKFSSIDGFGKVFLAFIFGGGCAIVVGLVLFHLGIEVRSNQQRLWYDGTSVLRAGGIVGNTGGFGHLASLWYGVCVIYITIFLKSKKILCFTFLVLVIVPVLVVTSSRAAITNISVCSFFWFCAHISSFAKLSTIFTVSVRAYVVLFLSLLSVLIMGQIGFLSLPRIDHAFLLESVSRLNYISIFDGGGEFLRTIRFEGWSVAFGHLVDSPVFGLGYKQYSYVSGYYVDNSFIGIAVDFGIPAALLFVLFWCSLLAVAYRLIVAGGPGYLCVLGFLLANILHAMTLDIYTNWYTMPTLLVFCMLFCGKNYVDIIRGELAVGKS